jgi:protein-S-isoprenylcysteine O-methyltransferase Ste14
MSFSVKIIVFLVASIGTTWVSLRSLSDFRSHGFYRFFAWEAILILILLNLNDWFLEPYSPHQIISWILLICCLFLVIHGIYLLRVAGKPDGDRRDPTLAGLEKTTELITIGAYRYIRHPLYSSLLLLAWGVFFKNPSYLGGFLALLVTFFLTVTAKIEEAENVFFFGDAYRRYMKHNKMFIPFIF